MNFVGWAISSRLIMLDETTPSSFPTRGGDTGTRRCDNENPHAHAREGNMAGVVAISQRGVLCVGEMLPPCSTTLNN